MPEVVLTLPKFHPKQQAVFDSKATEILFAGDTRAGKSFFVRKSYIVYCSQIPGLQCDIFRLHFDDVIGENMEGETSFPVLLSVWEKAGLVKITQTEIEFWNDSRISLEHCSDDIVMQKHQGIAKHVRTFSEASQIPERRIRALTGWVTMSVEMQSRIPPQWKGQFPKIFHVTNPVGQSAGYYRRHFVEARPEYSMEKVGPYLRQYIPADLEDNPSENAETTRARIREAFPDPAIQAALLERDWKARAGEFFPEWDEDRHVTPDFVPPKHLFKFRTYDWGTAEPAVVYWWCVSDGEPFIDEMGRKRYFPRGAFIAYREWLICDDGHANPEHNHPERGRRMSNKDMATGILERSITDDRKLITLTDSKPFQDMGGESIAETFLINGCPLTQADCSRVPGWSQMRSRLIGIEVDSNNPKRMPMLYITESCVYARDYIPALPRHPSESKKEDAAEHGEPTHSCDAIRYACMARTKIKDIDQPPPSTDNLVATITFDQGLKMIQSHKRRLADNGY